jgi:Sulfotransferase family
MTGGETGATEFVSIDSVEVLPLARDQLHGFDLDVPAPGNRSSSFTVPLQGWLLGKTGRAMAVEVLQEGRPVLRLPVCRRRDDLAEAFPEIAEADNGGFAGAVGALRLRSSFELLLRGVLDNGVHAPLARLSGRRRPIAAPGDGGPRPLIVTTLGRTGSTWCLWVLQSHPRIVAHSPFENDARVGSYWMSVLQTLSDPTSYLRQLDPGDVTEEDWWVGGKGDAPSKLRDDDLTAWLGHGRVEELAVMCRDRIGSFYDHLAAMQGKRPSFFVEKYLPRQIPAELLREVYPEAVEVVLVRDPRDMFCSILSFNRKRGYSAFGRESAASDEEYVETVRRSGESLLRHMRADGRAVHLLRYEDLIREPVQTLEPLLDFLGLDGADAAAMVERASIATDGMDHHMTAPSAGASIGRWRRDLDPELAELCDGVLSPIVAEFGYEPAADEHATR